jgi:hypothetical protein
LALQEWALRELQARGRAVVAELDQALEPEQALRSVPGTGGGPAGTYPPTPTQFFLPPLPAPASLKGYHLIAWFDVDEKGVATFARIQSVARQWIQ